MEHHPIQSKIYAVVYSRVSDTTRMKGMSKYGPIFSPRIFVQSKCFCCSGRLLSEPYLQLPPRTQFPDYDEVIAKPIAMNSIQAKIEHNKYKTVDAFYFEMDLVFENAKTYNQPQSRIYRDAVSLQVGVTFFPC